MTSTSFIPFASCSVAAADLLEKMLAENTLDDLVETANMLENSPVFDEPLFDGQRLIARTAIRIREDEYRREKEYYEGYIPTIHESGGYC